MVITDSKWVRNEWTYSNVVSSDAVVGVVDEQIDADGSALAQLGRRQQANAGQQLQLAPLHVGHAQETIQQTDGQRKYLLFAVLFLRHLLHQPIHSEITV